MSGRRAATLGTLVLLALSGRDLGAQAPSDTAAAIRAADEAAQSWLALIDAGRVGKSWEAAATAFQGAVTKAAWEQAVRQARSGLEPFGTRVRIEAAFRTELPNAPPGRYVLLQYRTAVAGGRQVVETVVPMWDGDRGWRVSGYFVRPE